MNKKLFGFTLAEVLITLAIIGVVAALTLPTLITNYQKKETVTKLQKAYAEIYQALRISEAKYGEPESWILGSNLGVTDWMAFLDKYLAQTINITEICNPNTGNCWGDNYVTLAGVKCSTANNQYPTFSTIGGYSVKFWGGNNESSVWMPHYQFIIDINGKKRPNMLGKDAFQFTYVRQSNGGWILIPAGYYGYDYHKNVSYGGGTVQKPTREEMLSNPNYGCSKNVTGSGGSDLCTALIYDDGWQIKEDYPW